MYIGVVEITRRISRLGMVARQQLAAGVLIALSALIIGWANYTFMPEAIDWARTYQPATLELLAGRSPYTVRSFFNPPWVLIPLIPMAVLPTKAGSSVLFIVSLAAIASLVRSVKAPLASFIALLLSFPLAFLLLFGQIDWMILLGLILPAQAGLFFVLAKPQIGLGITVFWLVEAWREGGLLQVARLFAPVIIAFALSLLIYGPWPLNTNPGILAAKYNFSLWPWSIPFGLGLLAAGLLQRSKNKAILAGPLLSPYVAPHSWSLALLPLMRYPALMALASLLSWLMLLAGVYR